MSGTSPQQLHAMRVAEWKAEAALTGRTPAAVICGALKASMESRLKPADEAWREIPWPTRQMLLAFATDRPTDDTKGATWANLTDDEKRAVGALARRLFRELSQAGRLR